MTNMKLPMTRDFSNLNFASFKLLALDNTLSLYEKIGFPVSYRLGYEEFIFTDIKTKLPSLNGTEKTVLDIGAGCSHLAHMLIEHCEQHQHNLLLADSQPMLDHLPNSDFIHKVSGMFPDTVEQIKQYTPNGVDIILCYSVLQYLNIDVDLYHAVHTMVDLLNPGGELLIGDIPNSTKRKRFFSSAQGIAFHKEFTGQDVLLFACETEPAVGSIDDTKILSIIEYVRTIGADAYVLPQAQNLPMANRREDIVIRKP